MTQDPTPSPRRRASSTPPSAAASAGLTLFVEQLQDAGLLGDMDDGWLAAYTPRRGEPRATSRRLDLLRAWYEPSADDAPAGVARDRRRADRFLLHEVDDPADAAALVDRLDTLTPELPQLRIERLGSADGPLVLRAAGTVVPILDDEASGLDTNEIDLTEVEDAPETVSVRSLVAAVNALLARAGGDARLVPLAPDATREAYVGVPRAAAEALLEAGLLEDGDVASLAEHAGWR